jgi:hypothetical protein
MPYRAKPSGWVVVLDRNGLKSIMARFEEHEREKAVEYSTHMNTMYQTNEYRVEPFKGFK